MNLWISGGETEGPYLNIVQYDRQTTKMDLEGADLFLGFDLSSTTEPSACGQLYRLDDRYHIDAHGWVPQSFLLREKQLEGKYKEFQEEKTLTIVPGNQMELERIADYIRDLQRTHKILGCGYDPQKAGNFLGTLLETKLKIPCVRIKQHPRYLSPSIVDFERAFTAKRITVQPNNFLRHQFGNLRTEVDQYGNVSFVRHENAKHYDSAIACMFAWACCHQPLDPPVKSVYEKRPVLWV